MRPRTHTVHHADADQIGSVSIARTGLKQAVFMATGHRFQLKHKHPIEINTCINQLTTYYYIKQPTTI